MVVRDVAVNGRLGLVPKLVGSHESCYKGLNYTKIRRSEEQGLTKKGEATAKKEDQKTRELESQASRTQILNRRQFCLGSHPFLYSGVNLVGLLGPSVSCRIMKVISSQLMTGHTSIQFDGNVRYLSHVPAVILAIYPNETRNRHRW